MPQAGHLIVGGAWREGKLPAPRPHVHVLESREVTGLAVAACGLRQESRSNGWAWYRADLHGHRWPACLACLSAVARKARRA